MPPTGRTRPRWRANEPAFEQRALCRPRRAEEVIRHTRHSAGGWVNQGAGGHFRHARMGRGRRCRVTARCWPRRRLVHAAILSGEAPQWRDNGLASVSIQARARGAQRGAQARRGASRRVVLWCVLALRRRRAQASGAGGRLPAALLPFVPSVPSSRPAPSSARQPSSVLAGQAVACPPARLPACPPARLPLLITGSCPPAAYL